MPFWTRFETQLEKPFLTELASIMQPQEDAIDTIADQVNRAAYQTTAARAELHKANENQQDCVVS